MQAHSTNKFLNETIYLTIKKTNYGHYRLIVDMLEDRYTSLTNNSLLIDSINSDENCLDEYGSVQDAIDEAVKYVLECNHII